MPMRTWRNRLARLLGYLVPFKVIHLTENRRLRRQITSQMPSSAMLWELTRRQEHLRGRLSPAAVRRLAEHLDELDGRRSDVQMLGPKRWTLRDLIMALFRPRR